MKKFNTAARIQNGWNQVSAIITAVRSRGFASTPRRTSKVYLFDADFSDDIAIALEPRSLNRTQSDSIDPSISVEQTNGSVTNSN